ENEFLSKITVQTLSSDSSNDIVKSISSLLRELTVGSHKSASDVNVSLKTIAGNSVSTDLRFLYRVDGDSAAKDEDPKYWPACYRIIRRRNGCKKMTKENIGNVLVNGNRVGCSYKEFLACNPKEYDGKGGAVVLTRWINKMENVQDMSGCSVDQKVKYTAGLFVGKDLTWWNSQIRTLSREVAISMSWNDFKFMMIEEFCPSHEMKKLETELWNHAMVEADHVTYTDRFHELARLVPHLVTPESSMIER
ncbi:reverse transcriptase domain-containing protein, partial [Tanacetum coccineum]